MTPPCPSTNPATHPIAHGATHPRPNGAKYDSPGNPSPNGAQYDSPGCNPGFRDALFHRALKGRPNRCSALSGLRSLSGIRPRALPWAIALCPVGAEEIRRNTQRAELEKQVNANLEGGGYGG